MMKRSIILVILALCLVVTACAEPAENISVLGVINGDTYENAFLGIGCTLEGWKYLTEEEILESNNLAKDILSEEGQKILEESTNFIMMAAQSPDGLNNVNIQVRNAADYMETFKMMGMMAVAEAGLDSFKTSLESSGFTDVSVSVKEITIGDQTVPCLRGEYKISSIQAYFYQPWLTSGDYLVFITLTCALSDSGSDVLSNFYLLQ